MRLRATVVGLLCVIAGCREPTPTGPLDAAIDDAGHTTESTVCDPEGRIVAFETAYGTSACDGCPTGTACELTYRDCAPAGTECSASCVDAGRRSVDELSSNLESLFEPIPAESPRTITDQGRVADMTGDVATVDFDAWGRRIIGFPAGASPGLATGDPITVTVCYQHSTATRGIHYVLELRDGLGDLLFSGTSGDAGTFSQTSYHFHSLCLPSYATAIEHGATECLPLALDAEDGEADGAMGLRLPVSVVLHAVDGGTYTARAGETIALVDLGLQVRVEAAHLRVNGGCADCPPSALLLFATATP